MRTFGLVLSRASNAVPATQVTKTPIRADHRPGFHPDDTTPIPRPSRYYGRRQYPPLTERLRRQSASLAPPLVPLGASPEYGRMTRVRSPGRTDHATRHTQICGFRAVRHLRAAVEPTCRRGRAATRPNTRFQYVSFDSNAKNIRGPHNRKGRRRRPRIRFDALLFFSSFFDSAKHPKDSTN